MSFFPNGLHPEPNMVDHGFWEHCRHQRLMFQSCGSCGVLRHPPTPFCASCHSTEVAWREAPKVGKVYTYTIAHHATDSSVDGATPYIIALIKFDDFGPVRLVTNILASVEEITIGLPVSLFWDRVADDMFLPLFKPVGKSGS